MKKRGIKSISYLTLFILITGSIVWTGNNYVSKKEEERERRFHTELEIGAMRYADRIETQVLKGYLRAAKPLVPYMPPGKSDQSYWEDCLTRTTPNERYYDRTLGRQMMEDLSSETLNAYCYRGHTPKSPQEAKVMLDRYNKILSDPLVHHQKELFEISRSLKLLQWKLMTQEVTAYSVKSSIENLKAQAEKLLLTFEFLVRDCQWGLENSTRA
ncbi:MAG TPA: hypothetical protein DCX14_03360 [Flavobacteriales bacterium]|nr:hypothetical protein [Flavobacteriales bacterium]